MRTKVFTLSLMFIVLGIFGCTKSYYKYFTYGDFQDYQVGTDLYIDLNEMRVHITINAYMGTGNNRKPTTDSSYNLFVFTLPIDTTETGLRYYYDSVSISEFKIIMGDDQVLYSPQNVRLTKWSSYQRIIYEYGKCSIPNSFNKIKVSLTIKNILENGKNEYTSYEFPLVKKEGHTKLKPGWISGH
ncbi:MAG: hypothetical protein R3F48_08375 [Candidatus Zixiibacteriota bacterium]